MNVGIIGAGNIGATIAEKLAALGCRVKLAGSKGADHVRDKAEKIGAVPADAADAVKDVEAVVLSIPFSEIPKVAGLFATVPDDVVVIDTGNYYPGRDGHIAEIDAGKPESAWASEQLGRAIVKAYNAILAETLSDRGRPSGTAERIAIPIAGDDAEAKHLAARLVDATGFDPVDTGSLANSWRQQPGTPAYCTELTGAELRCAVHQADKARAPHNRDALVKRLTELGSDATRERIVELGREMNTPR